MTTDIVTNDNEWLQFLEFVRRKYGENSSEYIRINHYANKNNKSVAQYYHSLYGNIIPSTASDVRLKELLKDDKFISLLNLDDPQKVTKFTEIYNDTDYLMKSLNTKQENVYIKCNPVDDNGVSVEGSNNMYGPNLSSLNSMLTDGGQSFSPATLFNNVGLQVFIAIIFVAASYGVGYLLFAKIPNYMIERKKIKLAK